jgi:Na+-driven multidrug efflux pump
MIPFVGQNLGAKKLDRIDDGIRFVNKVSLGLGAFMFVLFALFGRQASEVFNSDQTVVSVSYLYLVIVSVGYGARGTSITASTCFSALHKPYNAIMVNIIRMIIIFIPLLFIGDYFFGLTGIISGISISIISGSVVSVYWLNKTIEKFKEHPDFSNTEPVPVEEPV